MEIVEDLTIMGIHKGWCKEFVFIGIRFQLGFILVGCATEKEITVPKLPGCKGAELLACADDDIPGPQMVTIYLFKVATIVPFNH